MTTPELLRCPICRGVGFHPYGFYAAIEYPSGSSAINISPEKCRSCNNGIIGSPTPSVTRLVEASRMPPPEVLEAAEWQRKGDWKAGQERIMSDWILSIAAIEGKATS